MKDTTGIGCIKQDDRCVRNEHSLKDEDMNIQPIHSAIQNIRCRNVAVNKTHYQKNTSSSKRNVENTRDILKEQENKYMDLAEN